MSAVIHRLQLSLAEFLALPEYSTSLPTGTTIGKRWRRHHLWREEWLNGTFRLRESWWVGEYLREITTRDPSVVGDLPLEGRGPLINLRCQIRHEVEIRWWTPVIRVRAGVLGSAAHG